MRVGHRCFLLCDPWTLRSHLGIQFLVSCPLGRQIVLVENRSDWAFWNASFAVDAFIRMNEQNGFTFVKALHWTYDHAVSVFAIEAWLGDDMGH